MSILVSLINVVTFIGIAAVAMTVGNLFVIFGVAYKNHISVTDVDFKYYKPLLIAIPVFTVVVGVYAVVLSI